MDDFLKYSVTETRPLEVPRSPEFNLWCAVLVQLLKDVDLAVRDLRQHIKNKTSRQNLENKLARVMYEADSEHVRIICDNVELHHDDLKEMVAKIIRGQAKIIDFNKRNTWMKRQ